MSCDVGEATEEFENQLCSFSNLSITSPTSQLIRQPFRRFTCVTAHSSILPLLHLRHSSFSKAYFASPTSQALQSSFSNLSITSPTSQLILQPLPRFIYVTAHSPTLPLLHLRHNSFSNPSFASPTLQALHLIHLASRPWIPNYDRRRIQCIQLSLMQLSASSLISSQLGLHLNSILHKILLHSV